MVGGLAVHGDRTYHITHSRLVSPVHLDSYITSYLFGQGSLFALMMEAIRTCETSVNIYLTTRQYIPYLPP
jgi:phage tail sheath gpL-like